MPRPLKGFTLKVAPPSSCVQVECLGDLQGPKFRVGELAGEPVELKNGEIFEFHGSENGGWWCRSGYFYGGFYRETGVKTFRNMSIYSSI